MLKLNYCPNAIKYFFGAFETFFPVLFCAGILPCKHHVLLFCVIEFQDLSEEIQGSCYL